MQNNIKVITIDGCPRCKQVKEQLQLANIEFYEIDCENNATFCDDLESTSKQDMYPMIMVQQNGETFLIHTTDKLEELGKTILHHRDFYRKPTFTIEDMVNTLKTI